MRITSRAYKLHRDYLRHSQDTTFVTIPAVKLETQARRQTRLTRRRTRLVWLLESFGNLLEKVDAVVYSRCGVRQNG